MELKISEEEMRKLRNEAQALGYDHASGKKGTGWMQFSDSEIRDVKEHPNPWNDDKDVWGKAWSYAEGWHETHQFEHEFEEVSKKLKKKCDWSDPDDESCIYKYAELCDEWAQGYANFIMERIEEKSKKKTRRK
jgi:hypothetical protein